MTRHLLGECLFKLTEKTTSCGRDKKAMLLPERTMSLGKLVEQCKMAKRTEMDKSSECPAIRLEGDDSPMNV